MKAMLLESPGGPLVLREVETPSASHGQVLVKVKACAVCRTDLHVLDGELPHPKLPLIPGHEIVGVIEALGDGVKGFQTGQRVGIPWLGWTCGGIHMSDIPSFPYASLWHERSICSVANLTRVDGKEFLALAPRIPVLTETQVFPLAAANEALGSLRAGRLNGAAVLVP